MSGRARWRAFAVLAVAYFMTIVDLTIVNVALPTIGRKLHFSETNLQWVVTAYGLTFGGFLLLGGRAADLLGRRRIFVCGLVIFTAASLGCGLATTDTFLVAMRGIQGLGAAIVLPAALSIVMNMFEEGAERNRALGAWGAIAAAGGTVGLIAGGLLTRYVGWQYIFFLNVPIGAIALLLAPRVVPESRLATTRRRYDPLGALTATGGLLLLVYALSQAPQHGWAAAASSEPSSSAPSTCSRCSATRRSRRGSRGSPPRSRRSRSREWRRRSSPASRRSSSSPWAWA
jgi:MFS family permease